MLLKRQAFFKETSSILIDTRLITGYKYKNQNENEMKIKPQSHVVLIRIYKD